MSHPFIVNLHGTVQNQTCIFFVLDFAIGGDLFDLIVSEGRLTKDVAMFYSGQIILALEYLHQKGVLFRDLKPENILIHEDGFVKLTDFTFAKKTNMKKRSFTMCGTPEYMAPEILLNFGYKGSVDYWSLGIILVQMLAGFSPFYDEDPQKIMSNIRSYNIKVPKNLDPASMDLICELLKFDGTERLGAFEKGGA